MKTDSCSSMGFCNLHLNRAIRQLMHALRCLTTYCATPPGVDFSSRFLRFSHKCHQRAFLSLNPVGSLP